MIISAEKPMHSWFAEPEGWGRRQSVAHRRRPRRSGQDLRPHGTDEEDDRLQQILRRAKQVQRNPALHRRHAETTRGKSEW